MKALLISFALLFSSQVLALEEAPVMANIDSLTQHELRVDGMTCPFCAATSEKSLKKMDGVVAVATNLDKGVISVCTTKEVSFSDDMLKSFFTKKGFTYRSQSAIDGCSLDIEE